MLGCSRCCSLVNASYTTTVWSVFDSNVPRAIALVELNVFCLCQLTCKKDIFKSGDRITALVPPLSAALSPHASFSHSSTLGGRTTQPPLLGEFAPMSFNLQSVSRRLTWTFLAASPLAQLTGGSFFEWLSSRRRGACALGALAVSRVPAAKELLRVVGWRSLSDGRQKSARRRGLRGGLCAKDGWFSSLK